jgi:hypothetical protein
VTIVRSDTDVSLDRTGGWMGELEMHTASRWHILRDSEPKLSSVGLRELLDDLADAVGGAFAPRRSVGDHLIVNQEPERTAR